MQNDYQQNGIQLNKEPIGEINGQLVYGITVDPFGNQIPVGRDGYPINQVPVSQIDTTVRSDYVFKFLSYYFDKRSRTATFCYQGIDNFIFAEKITFAENPVEGKKFNVLDDPQLNDLLDRAMFLAFMMIGTSYFKAHPTPYVRLDVPLDEFQANFFNHVYQEGLGQFAFENKLTRSNLAHFAPIANYKPKDPIPFKGKGILALQSGGKDSLLVATMLSEAGLEFTPWYLTSNPEGAHPTVIDNLFDEFINKKASIAIRDLDLDHLKQSNGMNGHVPVTYIVESLALIQAILNNQNIVVTSIAQEGGEPHAMIGNLAVNHQWSKTWEAEQLIAEYIDRYISHDLHLGSPIRKYSELRVADLFVQKCWHKYGYQFSSCNQANYQQGNNNSALRWCGNCAKCANSYLLFSPFLQPQSLQALFSDNDLYANPNLKEIYKGLLGIDGFMKPFECVGLVDELRVAYNNKINVPMPQNIPGQPQQSIPPHYANLPFQVPQGDFNYMVEYPQQQFFTDLLTPKEEVKETRNTNQPSENGDSSKPNFGREIETIPMEDLPE